MKSKRKVVKVDTERYMALKPLMYDKGWEKIGKAYSIRGIASLVKKDIGIEFIVSETIKKEVEDYIGECNYRKYIQMCAEKNKILKKKDMRKI